MKGLTITPLKRIEHPKGNIFHAIKKSSPGFQGFGEAYFSTIIKGETKGWKRHNRMTLNLVVPVGSVRFCCREYTDGVLGDHEVVDISSNNYVRLTIDPRLWVAFHGLSEGTNLILNVADLEHDPDEQESLPLSSLDFPWPQGEDKK
jgi:dTDP-4-dehydrorhamnose 3,5-epimerase